MALLRNIGRAMKPGRGTASTLAIAGGAGVYGFSTGNVGTNSFDHATELLLGSSDVDEAVMGTSMGWGNWVNPFHNPATAATTGAVGGGLLGGLLGGIGRGTRGAVLGSILGGAVGAVGNATAFMAPYVNPSTVGDAFSEDRGAIVAKRLAERNVDAGWNLYDIPNSSYIGNSPRPTRLYDTGASGDMVFGMWNSRMG